MEAEDKLQKKQQAEKPSIKFGFVELLFALTAAEIAVQFADVVSKLESIRAGLPAYTHLALALVIVSTSWVGWKVSGAPGARPDVEKIFSPEFIVLLIDVLLVIFYFVLVKGVEQVVKTPDGAMVVIPSAANESLWTMIIFGGYFVWDFMTKAIISSDQSQKRIVVFKFFERAFWDRGWISTFCLVFAVVAWSLLKDANGTNQVMLADVTLLSLVLLFRALKQEAYVWAFISGSFAALMLAIAGIVCK